MVVTVNFSTLTREHGVKEGGSSLCGVEEVALAVGNVIGHDCVKSAARINGAVVLFVEKVAQAKLLAEKGIEVNSMLMSVLQLTQPATKITLSNVPPFISDDFLSRELSRHGNSSASLVRSILGYWRGGSAG